MFLKKMFSRKTNITIVSMVVQRKDKKTKMKTKKFYFSLEKTFLRKIFTKMASIGLDKKAIKE